MYKFSGKPTFDVYVTNLPDDIDEVKNQIMETFLTEDFFLKNSLIPPLCVCLVVVWFVCQYAVRRQGVSLFVNSFDMR